MSLFGWGRQDPDGVRKRLFDAVAREDGQLLGKLCKEHEALVLEHFAKWLTVPEAYRKPPAVEWYSRGVFFVAQYFVQLGHPQLLQLLAPEENNPIEEWREALQYVDQCTGDGRFREAADVALELLGRMERMQGSAVEQYLPLVLGRLGGSLFHAGEVEAARAPILRALACCEAGEDTAGVLTHLGNLYELQRYLGESREAAETLERKASLCERHGDTAQAGAHRRQAAIVRAGEPLCRVVVLVEGQRYETSELPRFGAARFSFIFERNRLALRASVLAVSQGERAGAAGEYTAALAHFERASQLDRFDPGPHYQRGLTLLHLRRYEEAVTAYATTEALAPGYFHVRSDRWLAERLAAGAVAHDVFLLLRHLFDGPAPAEEKASRALSALRTTPIALLHLAAGEALSELDRPSDAAAQYRSGLTVADEPDVRTRLLVALAVTVSERDERNLLLRSARELRGNLVAAATAELALRQEADS